MNFRIKLALLLVAAAPAAAFAAAPPPETAGAFLARAEPLLKKSAMSLMFSSEAKQMIQTIRQAGQRNRAELAALRAAGKSVTTCLPAKAGVKSNELLDYLRALPPARKAQSFDAAFAGLMAQKYPCRG